VPALADTSLRLLGQEPLAGLMPTARQLELAGVLDGAGFAYLEVSGGGCFDAAVTRGIESPWERIRALKSRTTTPLGLALRGRFLVGSRQVDGDFVRRFIATAAENGIDVFRLHDPLNDVENLRDAAEAVTAAGRDFEAGLIYSPGRTGETDVLLERARMLAELGAVRVLVHDPTGALLPHKAGDLVRQLGEASGLSTGIYLQGAAGHGLASALAAAQAGAELIACAVYPLALALHRVPAESLAEALRGIELDPQVDTEALWKASELVDQHIGDEPVTPVAPRVAVRAAQQNLPTGLVAGLDAQLRAHGSGDRLDEVLEELERIRAEAGWPPLAAPIDEILGAQALQNVLAASRYRVVSDEVRDLFAGRYGTPPGPLDEAVQRAAAESADGEAEDDAVPALDELREQAEGMAASEEELLLLGMFGDAAEPLLRSIRGRTQREDGPVVDQGRAERIRQVVQIVEESGVAELTIDEEGMRISVRRAPEAGVAAPAAAAPVSAAAPPPQASGGAAFTPRSPGADTDFAFADRAQAATQVDGKVRVESPMVGTFYRSPDPGSPPFVDVGSAVAQGQVLCILEAMKLMNEVKSDVEGVVRAIHVEDAQPVEFGQLLFEVETVSRA
jgi:oxaloacetate decarboxylase alpha subunit